jgi:hypothetical protein
MDNLTFLAIYACAGSVPALAAFVWLSSQTHQQIERELTDFARAIGCASPADFVALMNRRWLLVAVAFLFAPALIALAIINRFKTRGGHNG